MERKECGKEKEREREREGEREKEKEKERDKLMNYLCTYMYLVAITCLLFLLSFVAMAQLFCAVQSSCTLTFTLEYTIPSLYPMYVEHNEDVRMNERERERERGGTIPVLGPCASSLPAVSWAT